MRRSPINKISPKQQKRIEFRQKMKPVIFEEQGRKCRICGMDKPDFRGWELSHIVSLAQGGEDTKENLEVLCAPCHAKKHHLKEV